MPKPQLTGLPPAVTLPPEQRMSPVAAVVLGVAFLGWLSLMAVIFRPLIDPLLTESASASNPTPAAASFASPSSSTFPPELLMAANAISTFYAPTPEPTKPPPTTPRTPEPVIYCGQGSRPGEICEWPQPPLPTSTPIPDCGTPIPGDECRWWEHD